MRHGGLNWYWRLHQWCRVMCVCGAKCKSQNFNLKKYGFRLPEKNMARAKPATSSQFYLRMRRDNIEIFQALEKRIAKKCTQYNMEFCKGFRQPENLFI